MEIIRNDNFFPERMREMDTLIINVMSKDFNNSVYISDDGIEFWYARDLQKILGYAKWDKFLSVVNKAIESCETTGFNASDHFLQVGKIISLGKGAERKIKDFMLTRYACYLIAQNGDTSKEPIAFAQSYFAVQTRKQELIEKHMAELDRLKARKKLKDAENVFSGVLYEHGVDDKGFARIRSKGDTALFGGNSTNTMKKKLDVPDKRPLADFLPSITITAKQLATEITTHNVVKDNLNGEQPITSEHVINNKAVRNMLKDRGVIPENLPPETDIKKVEHKVKSAEKKLEADSKHK